MVLLSGKAIARVDAFEFADGVSVNVINVSTTDLAG